MTFPNTGADGTSVTGPVACSAWNAAAWQHRLRAAAHRYRPLCDRRVRLETLERLLSQCVGAEVDQKDEWFGRYRFGDCQLMSMDMDLPG